MPIETTGRSRGRVIWVGYLQLLGHYSSNSSPWTPEALETPGVAPVTSLLVVVNDRRLRLHL